MSCPWEAHGEDYGDEDEWAAKAAKAGWRWKTTLQKRRAAKRFKYSTELISMLPTEWHASLFTAEIGVRGRIEDETSRDLQRLFACLKQRGDSQEASKDQKRTKEKEPTENKTK